MTCTNRKTRFPRKLCYFLFIGTCLLLLSSCAGHSPHSSAYLDVSGLKANLGKRLSDLYAETKEKPPEIKIRRTAPCTVSIGKEPVSLFAVNVQFIHRGKDTPVREMTLLVDPSGELEFSKLNRIATGKNLAQNALDLANWKDIPSGQGNLLFEGTGEKDVLLVGEPFCPYCRMAYNYLQKKKGKIKKLRMLQAPLASHPGAQTAVMGLFFVSGSSKHSFARAADFAYNKLDTSQKEKGKKAVSSVIKQYKKAFPSVFKAVPQGGKGKEYLNRKVGSKMQEQLKASKRLAVSATPTIFIDGIPVKGFSPERIESLLRE